MEVRQIKPSQKKTNNHAALNVHELMQTIAGGTEVEIRDEILEGRLYYHGTASDYFKKVTPLVKLYVHNVSIKDNRLIITALDYTL